jgi:predicted SAM-dependent methyltransferase
MLITTHNTMLNLGCGEIYIDSKDWINLDFTPTGSGVLQANLLGILPFRDGEINVIYSSHFLEHIPRESVARFLKECFRVLSSKGIIRLVLPDFEELSREYLLQREKGEHKKADFLVAEIIDQCVRQERGGELAKIYQAYAEDKFQNLDIENYIFNRNGYCIRGSRCPEIVKKFPRTLSEFFLWLKKNFYKGQYIFYQAWIYVVVSFLPAGFRSQNVSFTSVGERHHWLWDFHQLKQELKKAGFANVIRQSCNTSKIRDFPFYPLDVTINGHPRKGFESMYVEAERLK